MALEFRYGWCTLRLASGPHEVSIKATTMHDAFADRADHMEHWGWDFPVAQYEVLLRNRALY
ncbi:hypothetical protein FB558_7263 [Pseudonocardia kunmingensis]|uniref:Uncharacterized protein n=1 Tax=Pseudonocardia kunmingensis TaxID=630975 RepID=A0A543D4I6_9PSEU|nr:hypothetical protein FB558_7263 [Pseudonocardia kunmingensis]